jgi:predicted Fe-S protein YdhL (DUF1289 family)
MIEYTVPVAVMSPCIGVCIVDEDDRCEGCGRTLDEIAGWLTMGPARRDAVMRALPGRLARRA